MLSPYDSDSCRTYVPIEATLRGGAPVRLLRFKRLGSYLITLSGFHALGHALTTSRLLCRSCTAPAADGDAAPHLGMYRTVIRNCSLPTKGYRVRVARVQNSRVERTIVGGNCVRLVALVCPSYRASRFNGHIRRVEEVVAKPTRESYPLALHDALPMAARHRRNVALT